MDADETRKGSPSKPAIESFFAPALEKLRLIFAEIEEGITEPRARELLDKSSGVVLFRLDFGHCAYVFARVPTDKKARLSPRQKEIAALFLTGLPRRKIAHQLKISPRTVDTHIERLFVKYGVGTRIELAQRIALMS